MIVKENNNVDLFIEFVLSFTHHQDRWVKLFNGKLKIDELTNEKMIRIKKYSKLWGDEIGKQFEYSLSVTFPDKLFVIDHMMKFHRAKTNKELLRHIISLLGSYEAAKVLMPIRHNFIKEFDTEITSELMGKGSIDGLELVLGYISPPYGRLDLFKRLINELKYGECKWLTNDLLLLEDYLCEFHMFYRLFGEKYTEYTPEQVIDMINNDEIRLIRLSEYVDSNLPYDEFQKQHIICILTKESYQNLFIKEINENGTV